MLVTQYAARDGREKIFAFFVVFIAVFRLSGGSQNRILLNTEREP